MSKLQPIETMPRDGTMVLVTDGVRWSDANWPQGYVIGRWLGINPRNGRWHGCTLGFDPMYWMELPAFAATRSSGRRRITMKHTPGPWAVVGAHSHGAQVCSRSAAGVSIAWCGTNAAAGQTGSHSIDGNEAEANARLIAAAPEMFALLSRLDDPEARALVELIGGKS